MKTHDPVRIALWINVLDILTYGWCLPVLVFIMLKRGEQWKWLITPDVPLPGDLTLPVVKAWHDKRGDFWCSWYWLAWRNRWHGLDFRFAQRLPLAWDQSKMGLQTQGDLWWKREPIWGGKYQKKTGWRLCVVDGIPYGVPCATITKA